MTKLRVLCLLTATLLLLTGIPGDALCQPGGVGQAQMRQAQQAWAKADAKGALKHVDQAIKAMEEAGVLAGGDDQLARAYYFKANVLLTQRKRTADLEQALNKAVQASPKYVPENNLISDPRIDPIYKRVLAKHNRQGEQAVSQAGELVKAERYCEAAALLKPYQNAFGAQKAQGEALYVVAERYCPKGGQQKMPNGPEIGVKRCGVLPVIIHSSLPGKSVPQRDFSDATLSRTVAKALGGRLQVAEIDHSLVDRWQRERGISALSEMVVRPGLRFGGSFRDLFAGGGLDPAFSKLPQRYGEALSALMALARVDHVLVVLVEIQPAASTGGLGTGGSEVSIVYNLFAAPEMREPLVANEKWRGLSEVTAEDKFALIGSALSEELSRRR